jgi:hypothetical protein
MDEVLTGKMKLLALRRGQQQAQAARTGRFESVAKWAKWKDSFIPGLWF